VSLKVDKTVRTLNVCGFLFEFNMDSISCELIIHEAGVYRGVKGPFVNASSPNPDYGECEELLRAIEKNEVKCVDSDVSFPRAVEYVKKLIAEILRNGGKRLGKIKLNHRLLEANISESANKFTVRLVYEVEPNKNARTYAIIQFEQRPVVVRRNNTFMVGRALYIHTWEVLGISYENYAVFSMDEFEKLIVDLIVNASEPVPVALYRAYSALLKERAGVR